MYQMNPERGCGTKDYDAFYVEGAGVGSHGSLWAFTWVLGDGMLGGNYLPVAVKPRQTPVINPIACIIERELIQAETKYRPTLDKQELYTILRSAMKSIGIGSHVSAEKYSVHSFAEECKEFGPSRRITKQQAKTLAQLIALHGPVPALFTHSRMPIFRNEEELKEAQYHVDRCFTSIDWGKKHQSPTWLYPNWGMYSRKEQYWGGFHALIPVLNLIGELYNRWDRCKGIDSYVAAKEFFDMLLYHEQPFGASWYTRVSYVLPKEGDKQDVSDIPGVAILNLDEPEKEIE